MAPARPTRARSLSVTALVLMLLAGSAAKGADKLLDGFREPPADARPEVFWQWINGNVTAEGIVADLAWMKRAGIGGAILFDIGFGSPPIPQYVDIRIGYGTAAWKDMVRLSAAEADRHGMRLGLQASGGWSATGGPWIQAHQAMKKLVWSELAVEGAGPITLPPPPMANGPFQDVPIGPRFAQPSLYGDIAVIAWPDPEPILAGSISSSAGTEINDGLLRDGAYASAGAGAISANGWIQVALAAPTTIHAVTIAVNGKMPQGMVEGSLDGIHFQPISPLTGPGHQGIPVRTLAFTPQQARFVRLRLDHNTTDVNFTEFALHAGPRLHRFQEKAGWAIMPDSGAEPTPPGGAPIPVDSIIDLSDRLRPDGSLDWRPPPGRWRVMRVGWSLTGRRNTPATTESMGLQVDKLNAAHVRSHMQAVLSPLKAHLGELYGEKGLNYVITDSWEAGLGNWTEAMPAEFKARRSYPLQPWLPVLAGRVVGSAEASEQFLSDFRRTIADLLTDNHYAEIARIAHQEGLLYAAEAPGVDLPTIADGIQAKGRTDMPMGEFWVYPADKPAPGAHLADIREAASAAHLYGRPLVTAEALTSMGEDPWQAGPWQHKRIVDRYMAEGVNHFVLHTAAHQPFMDRYPGMTLRQYGQHLSRNETWATEARAWTDYLARCAWLLRQGRAWADVAWFQGEEAPTALPWLEGGAPAIPPGHDFDYLDAESLLQRAQADHGALLLPSGARYDALVIPERVRRLSVPVLKRLEALAAGGVLIVGARPVASPTLSDNPAEWQALVDRLWQGPIKDQPLATLLPTRQKPAIAEPEHLRDIVWKRRILPDGELYFIANSTGQAIDIEPSFAVTGFEPEALHPDTGTRSPVTYAWDGDRTRVRLSLPAYGSVFILFRQRTDSASRTVPAPQATELMRLVGSWQVSFAAPVGPSNTVRLGRLASWTALPDPAIRYFSGTGTYETVIDASPDWLRPGRRLVLDLGDVREFATIAVNSQSLPPLWKLPFAQDIGPLLRPGRNHLSIRVTNFWANRMIGDLQPGATPVTFAPIQPFRPDSPLLPSGLMGPVILRAIDHRP